MAKQKTVPYKTVQKLGLKWANHDVSLFALIAITSLRPAARPYSFALTSPKCPQSLQRKVCDDGHPPHHFFEGRFPLSSLRLPCGRPQASRSILSAFPRASLILKMVGGSHSKPRRAPANPSHCL